MWKTRTYQILAAAWLATIASSSLAQEAALLDVLRSEASVKQKADACRELAHLATKDAVPVLAAMLGDEQLSHMARYALEPIPDPSVDEALRAALGTVQGRPLEGVIGSLGVRRDVQAVDALAGFVKGSDAALAKAAARALGNIGAPAAAQALEAALPDAPASTQRAICEGLLRCAETLTADQSEAAVAIYDRLRATASLPPHVRAAGWRGAILVRGTEGVPLMVEAINGPDYAMAAAAVRAAMELPGPEVTAALVAELPKATAERQSLLIPALAGRGEPQVLPAVLQAATGEDAQLRVVALRALKRVGDASVVPALLEAAAGGNAEVAEAALESLESLQDKSVDEQIVGQLAQAQGKVRLVLMDLATRRRAASAAPAFWKAMEDSDSAVRAAALTGLGAVGTTADLPKLIARLTTTKDDREAQSLDQALRDVSLRAADRESAAAQIAAALPKAGGPVQARILETLGAIGGAKALAAVADAARSKTEALRDAAYRILGQWNAADAAPVLLDLHNAASDERLKTRAIRAYIRIARQFDMPAEQRATMCRTALEKATRDEDKRLVLQVLLRYPDETMQAIAMEAAKDPALKDEAGLIMMAMANQGINRAELGRALSQAGIQPVKLEIIKAEYGAGDKMKDVSDIIRKQAKNYRIIFLSNTSYNEALGGDPVPNIAKQLKIKYRIDGKEGEVSLNENAPVVLPQPK